jgi:hypothetical protein
LNAAGVLCTAFLDNKSILVQNTMVIALPVTQIDPYNSAHIDPPERNSAIGEASRAPLSGLLMSSRLGPVAARLWKSGECRKTKNHIFEGFATFPQALPFHSEWEQNLNM